MIVSKKKTMNYWLAGEILVLIVLGLVFLASASSVVSLREYGYPYYKLKQQIVHGILPGFFLFLFLFFTPVKTIKKFIPFFMGVVCLMLVLVLFPGIGVAHGKAHSWLGVGFFSFQPSEVAKLALILYLSLWFSVKKEKEIKNFYYGFFPFVLILAVVVCLVILEPDLGTAIILTLIGLGIYFIAGAKKSHFFLLIITGILFVILLFPFASDYQKNRLISFLNPSADPQHTSYQINQAFLAVGSGGIWGRGLGNSYQKYLYLPEVEGDSVFAVVGEELGFVFSVFFITFLLVFFFHLLYLSKKEKDLFSRLIYFGFFLWVSSQTFINIGAIIGLLPLTGVTLPFVSYGGTSLAVLCGASGLLLNLSQRT